MPSTSPEEMGLDWQECTLATPSFSDREIEACFGHPVLFGNEQEKARYGERISTQGIQLIVGEDVYLADVNENIIPVERYTLYKNGDPVKTLWDEFTAFSPNISLQDLNGKVVWEFADHKRAAIVYDGVRVGPDFERITVAYCCEAVLYSVRAGGGRYLFQGIRKGQPYLIEIKALED